MTGTGFTHDAYGHLEMFLAVMNDRRTRNCTNHQIGTLAQELDASNGTSFHYDTFEFQVCFHFDANWQGINVRTGTGYHTTKRALSVGSSDVRCTYSDGFESIRHS